MKQSPIFVKHYDLMAWLIPCTLAFPKSQRGVLARQIQSELFRIEEGWWRPARPKHPGRRWRRWTRG
jgi:hypothetical protein